MFSLNSRLDKLEEKAPPSGSESSDPVLRIAMTKVCILDLKA